MPYLEKLFEGDNYIWNVAENIENINSKESWNNNSEQLEKIDNKLTLKEKLNYESVASLYPEEYKKLIETSCESKHRLFHITRHWYRDPENTFMYHSAWVWEFHTNFLDIIKDWKLTNPLDLYLNNEDYNEKMDIILNKILEEVNKELEDVFYNDMTKPKKLELEELIILMYKKYKWEEIEDYVYNWVINEWDIFIPIFDAFVHHTDNWALVDRWSIHFSQNTILNTYGWEKWYDIFFSLPIELWIINHKAFWLYTKDFSYNNQHNDIFLLWENWSNNNIPLWTMITHIPWSVLVDNITGSQYSSHDNWEGVKSNNIISSFEYWNNKFINELDMDIIWDEITDNWKLITYLSKNTNWIKIVRVEYYDWYSGTLVQKSISGNNIDKLNSFIDINDDKPEYYLDKDYTEHYTAQLQKDYIEKFTSTYNIK